MDNNPKENREQRRKMKFTPNAKKAKAQTNKIEALVEDEQKRDEIQPRVYLKGNVAKRQPKVEKQSSVQVAFLGGSSLSPTTLGNGKGKNSGSESKVFAIENQSDTSMIDVTDDTTDEEDYKEPWNPNSNHPIVLPLRVPNSGNPDILDEQEFGDAATNVEYDGKSQNPSEKLEFLDNGEQKLIFLQLPHVLPSLMNQVSRKGKEKIGTSKGSEKPVKGSNLSEIPSGFMGKMLVYKSGKVKLKIGETLFDVSPGPKTICARDVVAINTEKKEFSVIGPVTENVVVTADVDSIVDIIKAKLGTY